MKIGIIGGTGGMGKGFALRWSKNHEVIIGSRDAERASSSATEYTNLAKEAYGEEISPRIIEEYYNKKDPKAIKIYQEFGTLGFLGITISGYGAANASNISYGLVAKEFESIDSIAPFGIGNPKPKFLFSNVRIIKPNLVGESKKHLSFFISDGIKTIKAIIFYGLDNAIGNSILSNYKKEFFSFIGFVKKSVWKNKVYFETIIEDGILSNYRI